MDFGWVIVLWAIWKPESLGFTLGRIAKGFFQTIGPVEIDHRQTIVERRQEQAPPTIVDV